MNKYLCFLFAFLLLSYPTFAGEFWIRTPIRGIVPSLTVTKEGELNANGGQFIFLKKTVAGVETWDTICKRDLYFKQTTLSPRGEIFAATGQGVWQSNNDGKSWQKSNAPALYFSNYAAIVSDKEGILYAGDDSRRVYRSRDNGKSWRPVLVLAGWITALEAIPNGDVYAGSLDDGRVYRLTDQGNNWQQVLQYPSTDYSATSDIVSSKEGNIFVGNRQGLWVLSVDSTDFVQDTSITYAEAIGIDSAQNIYVYGASTLWNSRILRFSKEEKQWQQWQKPQDSTIGYILEFFTTPDGYTYVGSYFGLYRSVERSIDHPVVWGTVQSCDEATFVVMDDSLASVDFVQSSSSNVSFSLDGSFPSPKVKVTVKLIDSGKEGTYTLHAKNVQGKELTYTAHLNTFIDKPTIEQSHDTLWASGGYIFQWYRDGEKLNDEEKEYYVPKQDGKYSVTSIHVNGCMTESVPYNFTLSGVEQPQTETGIILDQNSPNPFSQRTSIGYTLSHTSFVRLIVTDALGRTVSVLTDGVQETGEHSAELNAQALSTGVYYYRLETVEGIFSRQMTVIR